MTLDGFLGAFALGAALFALVPAVQRLRVTLAHPNHLRQRCFPHA